MRETRKIASGLVTASAKCRECPWSNSFDPMRKATEHSYATGHIVDVTETRMVVIASVDVDVDERLLA